MLAYFRSLYQSRHQRRRSLDTAASDMADAERIPLYILLFLLFGLPLIFAPSLLTDRAALLWWIKGWTPVWIVVTGIVYAYFYFPRVPTQVVSATIDAMEQTDPDAHLVSIRERVEIPCPLLLQVTNEVRQRETVVQSLVAERRRRHRRERRKRRLREIGSPFLYSIPLFSSHGDSSE